MDFSSPAWRGRVGGPALPWPPADPAPGLAPAPGPPLPPDQPDIVETSSFNTGLMVFLLLAWASVGHKAASRSRYLGEGSVACAMGLATGLALLMVQRFTAMDQEALQQLLTFNPADFFTYFLPPIIFYAGLSVKKKKFFRNFGSIATLGILGTYILFAVIAFCLYAISMLPNLLSFADCLALGAIFAATDTVAVLQVIRPEEAGVLYSLVFGEGVMNDATSVAILRAVQSYNELKDGVAAGSTLGILTDFLYLFVASLALGMVFGLGTAFLLKFLQSDSSPQEVALIGMLAYLSYLCGELLGISGIVSLFCCGVIISHYALHNVTSMTRVTTVSAFQTLSYIAEGCIFIYVGLDTLDPLKWKNTYYSELIWLLVTLLVLLLVGRALYVVPACWLHNLWSSEKVSVRDVVIIWWGGLQRGAVSVALIYRYFDPHGQALLDAHRSTLITTTLLLVLFSTMVFGALTKPMFDLVQGHAGEDLSTIPRHMMELMPHRRKRGRAGRAGRAPVQGFGGGGGRYAAVIDMHRMDDIRLDSGDAGRPDGGLEQYESGAPSELSLESGSSSPRGAARTLPPELNGLDDPDRWWKKGQQQLHAADGTPQHTRLRAVSAGRSGLGGLKRPPYRQPGGYAAPDVVSSPTASQTPSLDLPDRAGPQPQLASQPLGSSHKRLPSADAIAFSEMDRYAPEDDDVEEEQGSAAEEPRPTGEHGALNEEIVQIDAAPAGDAAPLISLDLHRDMSIDKPNTIAALWRSFDTEYMQPIFGGPGSGRAPPGPSSGDGLTELQEVDNEHR